MNLFAVVPNAETWQYIAWFLALIEIILGLYILALNFQNTANRHLSFLLALTGVTNLVTGLLLSQTITRESATTLTCILGATSAAFQPLVVVLTVILFKPTWHGGLWRWARWLLYGLMVLPVGLTIADVNWGTRLWYTGLPANYAGGFVSLSVYAAGSLAAPIRILAFPILSLAAIIIALYAAWRDKSASPATRRLAWMVCGALLVAAVIQFSLANTWGALALLGSSSVYALVYGYAIFRQLVSERRLQRGRLQLRLTLLVLTVAAPLLTAVVVFVTNRAGQQIQQDADERLRASYSVVKAGTEMWLDSNLRALAQLVALPDIISMDPAQQKPVLEAMARTYPHMYLVSTIGLDGVNVARSDSAALTNYGDRQYFRSVRDGADKAFQVLIGRTTNKPALVVAMPIKDSSGKIVGVGMFASELTQISESLKELRVGQAGYAYIVSADNYLIAHPDPQMLLKDNQLKDVKDNPPVKSLRLGSAPLDSTQQAAGILPYYTDEQGMRWRYVAGTMSESWGIVVQQPDSELQAIQASFQNIAWITVLASMLILGTLVSLIIRQAIRPIGTLTQVTASIAAGDLGRTAPVESEDELGALARSFNSMTEQLRALIGGLEQRVAERTRDLARRSDYLAASAEVAHAASSILDSERLVKEVVGLIRERFNLYYVGLFLVDEEKEWAVLHASTGQPSQAMLARGHKLALDDKSMVGWSISNAQARIAVQAEADAVRRITAERPETHSEAVLPLRSRGQVLGALTVQSAQPNAFDEETVTVLQTMADQIAIALENARLLAESHAAIEAMRRASGELSLQGWSQLLRSQSVSGVRSVESGVAPIQGDWPLQARQAMQEGRSVHAGGTGAQTPLAIPIKVRGNVIGVIDTAKPSGSRWTPEEIALAEALADQLGTALESARLYQDTQRRAAREKLTGEIAAHIRETLQVDKVLRTAAREFGEALGGAEVSIRLAPKEQGNGNGR